MSVTHVQVYIRSAYYFGFPFDGVIYECGRVDGVARNFANVRGLEVRELEENRCRVFWPQIAANRIPWVKTTETARRRKIGQANIGDNAREIDVA